MKLSLTVTEARRALVRLIGEPYEVEQLSELASQRSQIPQIPPS